MKRLELEDCVSQGKFPYFESFRKSTYLQRCRLESSSWCHGLENCRRNLTSYLGNDSITEYALIGANCGYWNMTSDSTQKWFDLNWTNVCHSDDVETQKTFSDCILKFKNIYQHQCHNSYHTIEEGLAAKRAGAFLISALSKGIYQHGYHGRYWDISR